MYARQGLETTCKAKGRPLLKAKIGSKEILGIERNEARTDRRQLAIRHKRAGPIGTSMGLLGNRRGTERIVSCQGVS